MRGCVLSREMTKLFASPVNSITDLRVLRSNPCVAYVRGMLQPSIINGFAMTYSHLFRNQSLSHMSHVLSGSRLNKTIIPSPFMLVYLMVC